MSAKQEALQALDMLSETTTWDDIMYTIYVRQKISRGISDIQEKKTISHEEAVKRLISDAY